MLLELRGVTLLRLVPCASSCKQNVESEVCIFHDGVHPIVHELGSFDCKRFYSIRQKQSKAR